MVKTERDLGTGIKIFNTVSKKGTSEMWWIIVAAIIALVAVIIILVWFTGAGGRLFGNLDTTISGLKDSDLDGASDLLDKCPCDANEEPKPGRPCTTDKLACAQKIKEQKEREAKK